VEDFNNRLEHYLKENADFHALRCFPQEAAAS